MKHVWVTGAAGFIGFRLVERLVAEGYSVLAIDSLPHFRDRPEHGPIFASTSVEQFERKNLFANTPALMTRKRPDAIFHIGACSDTMNLDEAHHRKWNLEYSQQLWEFCTKNSIPLVYASSAAVYGSGEHGYSDNEALTPKLRALNPYGESKRLFDVWAIEQDRAGKKPPAWSGFRFFNVYGFGERHKGRMASVVLHSYDQILKEGQAKLFQSHREGIAHGEQKRDFVAVEDVVDVLLYAARKPIPRGVFNLGTGHAQTFLDLARAVFAAVKKPEKIVFVETPLALRERYQYFTQADLTRLRAEGYSRPFRMLEDAVPGYVARLEKGR